MTIFRASPTRVVLLAVGAAGLASSILYFAQGGFGRGHGRFDLAIFILGLPWDLIISFLPYSEWPSQFRSDDYSWLIGIPLVLNVATVLAVRGFLSRRRRRAGQKIGRHEAPRA